MIKQHTETPGAVIGEEGLTYEDWPPRVLLQGPVAGYGVGGSSRHPAPPNLPLAPNARDLLTASPVVGPGSWTPYPGVVRQPPATPQVTYATVEPIEETERDVGGPAPPTISGNSPPGTSGNASGDDSPSDVGSSVTAPWVPGIATVITQQWGPTSYPGEPAPTGNEKTSAPAGTAHWHAGVDLGYDGGTMVEAPVDPEWWQGTWFQGIAQAIQGATNASGLFNAGTFHHGVWNGNAYVEDPEGYGSHAATLTLMANDGTPSIDVVLGHGQQYYADDNATVRPGDALIAVGKEGNATGFHLHFEVRPYHGVYGSDVDPWSVLTGGGSLSLPGASQVAGIGNDVEQAAAQIGNAITQAENDAVNLAIGSTMVLGGGLLLGGAAYIAFRGFQVPSVKSLTPRRSQTPRQRPVTHPEARVARATRAAPSAPRIPRGPADAQPVNSSAEAAQRGLGPRPDRANQRLLSQRSRIVSENARRSARAAANRPTTTPF